MKLNRTFSIKHGETTITLFCHCLLVSNWLILQFSTPLVWFLIQFNRLKIKLMYSALKNGVIHWREYYKSLYLNSKKLCILFFFFFISHLQPPYAFVKEMLVGSYVKWIIYFDLLILCCLKIHSWFSFGIIFSLPYCYPVTCNYLIVLSG